MWIVVEAGPNEGEAAEVAEELLIGSADSCDLPLNGRDVSAHHALVRGGRGTATLTDLGTPSGTFLNGMRLVGSLAVVPGDHIRIGEATTLEVLLDAPGTPSALGAAPLPEGVTPAFQAADMPSAEDAPAPEAPARRRGAMIAAIVVVVLLVAGVATALAVGGGGVAAAARITSFTASAASPIEVKLSWSTSGQGFTKFTVTRDGQTLGTVSGNATTYEDATALPAQQYVYAITGTARNGKPVSKTSHVAMPAPPPLEEARLSGRFDVNTVFLQETYQNKHVGEKDYTVWAMTRGARPGPAASACGRSRRARHRRSWRRPASGTPGPAPTSTARAARTRTGSGRTSPSPSG